MLRISDRALVLGKDIRIPFAEFVRVSALALFMVVLWCNVYGMTSLASWGVPRLYGGDGWWYLAMIKSYSAGEISPVTFQNVPSLNAPFSANWNDYPSSEKMLPFCVGIAARLIGLMPAFNFAALLAVILAALSFYLACRILDFQWMLAFMGAVMFGFSHYMSARMQGHLSLTYYWHIPLFLIVTWWCLDSKDLSFRSPRWWFAIVVGILTGIQAIYYAFLFWQFLGFALLVQGLRRNTPKAVSILSIGAVSVGCTVLLALPLVLYRLLHGTNTAIVQRSLTNLQVFGLQLPELFLPPYHRWTALFNYGQTHYFEVSLIRGEMGSPYLGVIGILGFLWLMGFGLLRLLQGKAYRIPVMFWQSLWIILFSVIGGLNLVLGVCGLQLFRGTNRFSIILLCLGLMFLVQQLTRLCPKPHYPLVALVLCLVGLWDILPPFLTNIEGVRYAGNDMAPAIAANQKAMITDREFARRLEQNVPVGAMIFQMPVMDFPEVVPHLGVGDYTYFRPYFYTRALHFSYGSDKGRARESWQRQVEYLPAPELAEKLEGYGFAAIVIDRRGYPDGASSLLKDLESSGHKVIDDDGVGEFVAVSLRSAAHAVLPDIPPFPADGFYGWEGDCTKGAQTWSEGSATLILTNNTGQPVKKQYTFAFNSILPRSITVITPSESKVLQLEPDKLVSVGPVTINLVPGETRVRFETDAPPTPSGTRGDPRRLAFALRLMQETAVSPDPVPVLSSDFYGWEGDWRKGAHTWCRGSATLTLLNMTSQPIRKSYTFELNTTSRRHVTVITPTARKVIELIPGNPVTVGPIDLTLAPGETPIHFETDQPPAVAGPGDPRTITFSVRIVPQL